MEKLNYIDESIKIDFEVWQLIKDEMHELQNYDNCGDEDYYESTAEILGVHAKAALAAGDINEQQYKLICRKYGAV